MQARELKKLDDKASDNKAITQFQNYLNKSISCSWLEINKKNLTDSDIPNLIAFLKINPHIKVLNISNNQITDKGAIELLSDSATLEGIIWKTDYRPNIKLTDASAEAFRDHPSLIALDISWNNLTDVGIAWLSGSDTISTIDFSHNKHTNRGVGVFLYNRTITKCEGQTDDDLSLAQEIEDHCDANIIFQKQYKEQILKILSIEHGFSEDIINIIWIYMCRAYPNDLIVAQSRGETIQRTVTYRHREPLYYLMRQMYHLFEQSNCQFYARSTNRQDHVEFGPHKRSAATVTDLERMIQHIRLNPTITSVSLSEKNIPCNALHLFENLKKLQSMNLSGNKIGHEPNVLEALYGLPLTKLDLSSTSLHDDSAEVISKFRSLKTLNLSNNYFTQNGVKLLVSHLEESKGIEEIAIGNNEIGFSGVQELLKLPIKKLSIDYISLKSIPTALIYNSSLIELNIEHNSLGADDAKTLALSAPPNLAKLNISGNSIRDLGVLYLLKIPTLTTLDLRACSIGYISAIAISRYPFEKVDLSYNTPGFGYYGLAALSNSNIKKLHVIDCFKSKNFPYCLFESNYTIREFVNYYDFTSDNEKYEARKLVKSYCERNESFQIKYEQEVYQSLYEIIKYAPLINIIRDYITNIFPTKLSEMPSLQDTSDRELEFISRNIVEFAFDPYIPRTHVTRDDDDDIIIELYKANKSDIDNISALLNQSSISYKIRKDRSRENTYYDIPNSNLSKFCSFLKNRCTSRINNLLGSNKKSADIIETKQQLPNQPRILDKLGTTEKSPLHSLSLFKENTMKQQSDKLDSLKDDLTLPASQLAVVHK